MGISQATCGDIVGVMETEDWSQRAKGTLGKVENGKVGDN